jgi:DNA-binding YbaB/EbfC family protein
MPDFNKILKQAKAMQSQVMKMQDELRKKEFEGISGGGMVKVVLNGSNELIALTINPEVVNPQEVEMLEDLIAAAHAAAHEKIRTVSEDAFGSLSGGLSLPGT